MRYRAYAKYKDSGVEWLGAVPDHWDFERFKNVFSVSIEKNGVNPVGQMLSVSGYRGIEIKKYDDEGKRRTPDEVMDYRVVREGQLVVNTMWLNYAGLGVSKYNGYVSPAYRSYWISDQMYPRYVHHLLRSENYVAGYKKYMQGIRPNSLQIKTDDFLVFPVLTPLPAEQTAIANFLDRETAKIDTLIAKQQELIKLLKEKRQAVISHAVTKGLNPDVPMKDSGVEWLGEVPEHWDVTKAKFVSKIFIPQRNKPKLNDDAQGVYWATMEDMGGQYIDGTKYYVSNEAIKVAGSKILKAGSVIASCVGNFGIASINMNSVIINQQLQAFMPCGVKAEYLREIVGLSKAYFESIGTAATLVYVNQEGFENLPVLTPPWDEQESICQHIEMKCRKFNMLITRSNKAVELLQERRTALISAAVTGKIDVRTVDSDSTIQ